MSNDLTRRDRSRAAIANKIHGPRGAHHSTVHPHLRLPDNGHDGLAQVPARPTSTHALHKPLKRAQLAAPHDVLATDPVDRRVLRRTQLQLGDDARGADTALDFGFPTSLCAGLLFILMYWRGGEDHGVLTETYGTPVSSDTSNARSGTPSTPTAKA